jgi:iron-sulfur cluster assembly protein
MENRPHQAVGEAVAVSARAAEELKRIMAENKIPDHHGLRIGIKEGGCSGMSYVLGFDQQPQESDHVFTSEGMSVFVDQKDLAYVTGASIDYSGGLNGRGFVVDNPNVTKTCECGQSSCC